MIDQDGDGRVTEADLRVMLSELGMCPHRKHSIKHRPRIHSEPHTND